LKNILERCKSVKNILKSNLVTGNRLHETGNQLPESKYSGNLEKILENSFVKQNCAMFGFLKNTSLVKS